jgi:4-amino-4-deoxy-L-arabinose transferase-like glycosyltransferase
MRFSWIVGLLILFRIIIYVYFVGLEGEYLEEDSGFYLWLADILREHHVFSQSEQAPFSPHIFRTPGYPAFLVLLHKLGMASPYWTAFWQELIYGLSVLLFYRYGKTFFGEKLTRIAVVFLLLEPGGLSTPKMILSETLFLPFLFGGLFAIGYYLRFFNWRYLALAGVLMGIGAYIRPAILFFPVIAALALVIFAFRDKKRWLHASVLIITFIMVISPWLLRNYYHFGKLVMSGQQSNMLANYHVPVVWESALGIPFWKGHKQIKAQVNQAVEEKAEVLQRRLNTIEILEVEQQLAFIELKKYPWHYLKQWCFGILKTMNGANLFGVYHAFRYQVERLHFFDIEARDFMEKVLIFLKNQDYFYIFEVLLRVLIGFFALIGAVWIMKKKNCFFWIIMLANFYFICTPGPMGYARFRFPVEVFWFIQAYYGFFGGLEVLHNRRHPKTRNIV